MVAKSYQSLRQVGTPFEDKGRKYVKVETAKGVIRAVRWYEDYEYYKMYPEERKKVMRPLKQVLGFDKGYITIFRGNTYENRQWFKDNGARYHNQFGWYIVSTMDLPESFPDDIEPLQLKAEDVFADDNTLMSSDHIRTVIDNMTYEPDSSEFVGTVGERIEVTVRVERIISLDGYYGTSWLHSMRGVDDGNVYVWTTSSKQLPQGETIKLRGTIKDHKEYRNCKQTVLTRCKVLEQES